MIDTYFGKVCPKHPELKGERRRSTRACLKCHLMYKREWAKRNRKRDRVMAMIYSRLRKQKISQACPPWTDKRAIALIYANRAPGEVIDHVVPLVGIDPKTGVQVVCGLHVPWNLRIVKSGINDSKWAWFDPEACK